MSKEKIKNIYHIAAAGKWFRRNGLYKAEFPMIPRVKSLYGDEIDNSYTLEDLDEAINQLTHYLEALPMRTDITPLGQATAKQSIINLQKFVCETIQDYPVKVLH